MLEIREAVAVLADADLFEPAPRSRVEKALHPVEIIGAALKVHMVVDFHAESSYIMSASKSSRSFLVTP